MSTPPELNQGPGLRQEVLALLGDAFSPQGKRILDCQAAIETASRPPLPYDDGQFDVAIAISTFSHLADDWAAWLAELHRVLAEGGLLAASYHGPSAAAAYPLSLPLEEERIGMEILRSEDGFNRSSRPAVVHSRWWIEEHWGRGFELLQERPGPLEDGAGRSTERLVLLRRRPGRLTAEDLSRVRPDDHREMEALRHQARRALAESAAARAEILSLASSEVVERTSGPAARLESEAEREHLARQLRIVHGSLSWRLTTPVRWLGRKARALRHPRMKDMVRKREQKDEATVSVEGLLQGDEEGTRPSGERFVPEGAGGLLIEAEHEARYRWAAPLATGHEVLDAGCGVGYGAAILARAGARRAVGVDRSPEAISNAADRVGDLAEFVIGDLMDLPFPDDSFDLVTCFEAIEHVSNREVALDELRRVVRPEGVLAISSPNRDVYLPGNPHHIHEFTPAELEEALGRRFANVRLYRQQANVASSITDDSEFSIGSPDVEIRSGVRRVTVGVPGKELYTLAIASNSELSRLRGSVVVSGVFDLTSVYRLATDWEARARRAESEVAAMASELTLANTPRDRLLILRRRLGAPFRALRRLGRRLFSRRS
jgi:ubiquinone/menaquinone biosynthesis C-methylase UbiE